MSIFADQIPMLKNKTTGCKKILLKVALLCCREGFRRNALMQDAKSAQVINFQKVRDAKIEEKRRKYERVFFKNILGSYCVAEGHGLKAIELVDLSLEGLSFQLPEGSKNLDGITDNKEMVLRFYFSEDTYIAIQIKILNKRPCIEGGSRYWRFGCAVDTTLQSYDAYKHFVSFLGSYAERSQQDKGELKFFFF